jgi:hypothetical protein
MEAASTSETWVKFYQTTWHSNPEDSHLQAVFFLLLHQQSQSKLAETCLIPEFWLQWPDMSDKLMTKTLNLSATY